jgi:hypothetical protein
LIRDALHPYKGVLIATKAGLTRPGPDQWIPNGHPAHLIAQAKGSLRKLGVRQIDLQPSPDISSIGSKPIRGWSRGKTQELWGSKATIF